MDFCEKKKISHCHIPTKDIRIDYGNYEFLQKACRRKVGLILLLTKSLIHVI